MRRFRYIGHSFNDYGTLTTYKEYIALDVEHKNGDLFKITLINDYGIKVSYYIYGINHQPLFLEVTKEHRNKIIKYILS